MPEPDYHTARGSGAPGCSCYWCDPENHDPETCEFPHCGCKVMARVLERLIPKVDCLCGCMDDEEPPDWSERETESCDCRACRPPRRALPPETIERYMVGFRPRRRAEYPSPLGEGEAELRHEWMDGARARSFLRRSRSERRPEPEHDCGGQPEGAKWCPHCGKDLRVGKSEVRGRGEYD